jgi:cystathionine beta-lyase/cystathionine gamma-synthase
LKNEVQIYAVFFIFDQKSAKKMKNTDFIFNILGEENLESVSPPIFQTSNFRFRNFKSFRDALADEEKALIYSRGNNPTLGVLAEKLAALEGGGKALLFSSGMGAISTAILSVVKSGDHAICVEGAYSWTHTIFTKILPHYGVDSHMVPAARLIENITPLTRLVFIESPLTKTFELLDLKLIANAAHAVGAVVMIDNSYSTPLLQRPMDFGVDMVLYSATKYIGGHSDVVGGVLICGSEKYSEIFKNEYLAFGAIMSPMSAWLFLRGLRTMPIRLKQIAATTKQVIGFLESRPEVEKLLYPGSISEQQMQLFQSQMKGISGLFSVQFKNKSPEVMEAFVNNLRFFQMAVSWGGHESLVLPYALWDEQKHSGMVRFSIGFEEPETLIADLEQSLDCLSV